MFPGRYSPDCSSWRLASRRSTATQDPRLQGMLSSAVKLEMCSFERLRKVICMRCNCMCKLHDQCFGGGRCLCSNTATWLQQELSAFQHPTAFADQRSSQGRCLRHCALSHANTQQGYPRQATHWLQAAKLSQHRLLCYVNCRLSSSTPSISCTNFAVLVAQHCSWSPAAG